MEPMFTTAAITYFARHQQTPGFTALDLAPGCGATQRQRWIDVCTAACERIRQGHTNGALRDYAATNPGEFFAVATEAFFTAPEKFSAAEPELYDVLRAFYRQDPAARTDRAASPR